MSTQVARPHAFDRRRTGVATRRADDRHALAPLAEHVVEEAPDELQGDVLERQRRTVEQLGNPLVVADLHQRDDGLVTERRVGVAAHRRELRFADVVTHEWR